MKYPATEQYAVLLCTPDKMAAVLDMLLADVDDAPVDDEPVGGIEEQFNTEDSQ